MFLGRENSVSRKSEKCGGGGVPVWERGGISQPGRNRKCMKGPHGKKRWKKPAGPGCESCDCHVKTVRQSVDCAERL